jgi:hypothetical protein
MVRSEDRTRKEAEDVEKMRRSRIANRATHQQRNKTSQDEALRQTGLPWFGQFW